MTNNTPHAVTSVRSTGVALADYDVVRFSVSLETREKTTDAAKEELKVKVAFVEALVAELKASGVNVVENSTVKTVSVQPDYDYSGKKTKLVGYVGRWRLSFQTDTMDKVDLVFDRLTSLKEAVVDNPSFKVKDLAGLHKEGLKDAFVKAQVRFNDECGVLGLKASDYEISAWSVSYSENESGGARPAGGGVRMAAMSIMDSPASSEPLELDAGQAKVLVNLNVSFSPKGWKNSSSGDTFQC